jgi:hypothetical protein
MARKPRSAHASKLLAQMSRNPKADWRIEQLETVARAHDVNVRRGRGSHVVFEHPWSDRALSVPTRRPIKPVYVRRFVGLISSVEGLRGEAIARGNYDNT